MTPSEGVVTDGSRNTGEIPYQAFVDVTVRPIKSGCHPLKVETMMAIDGVELRRTEIFGIIFALRGSVSRRIGSSPADSTLSVRGCSRP